MSDSVRPQRWQPTRLPHPWDSSGKNTGVGCHFLLQSMKVKSESEVAQSCPTLSNPMDCSPPGSSIHGIFQARVLEWGANTFKKFVKIELSNHCCLYFRKMICVCVCETGVEVKSKFNVLYIRNVIQTYFKKKNLRQDECTCYCFLMKSSTPF